MTTGTEITSGEVVNTNAAWLSRQIEDLGVRVFSHLSVRDQSEEIWSALEKLSDSELLVLTGGLGPTSDDVTREVVARWAGLELEFDQQVWSSLVELYRDRQLPLREAHRHQCYFPVGSERLVNPVGTAYGFALKRGSQQVFVLPGPPRELEGMWSQEVLPRIRPLLKSESRQWVRWTCLGAPESEIAELVEPVLNGRGFEVGYRAQVPYVKVKIFADPNEDAQLLADIDQVLGRFVVARGNHDLATEFLLRWPSPVLEIEDHLTGIRLSQRMFETRRAMGPDGPEIKACINHSVGLTQGLILSGQGDKFTVEIRLLDKTVRESMSLPYKLSLSSERGQRSAVEWSIWLAVKALSS